MLDNRLKAESISSADVTNAAKYGRLAELERYVDICGGATVNGYHDNKGRTAIFLAAASGHYACCELLLKSGAPAEAHVGHGLTPLHAACDNAYADCARLLLRHGASVNDATRTNGDTPLHLAAYRGYLDVCRLLVDSGADVGARNANERTPREEATIENHTTVAEYLMMKAGKLRTDITDTTDVLQSRPLTSSGINSIRRSVNELFSVDKSSGTLRDPFCRQANHTAPLLTAAYRRKAFENDSFGKCHHSAPLTTSQDTSDKPTGQLSFNFNNSLGFGKLQQTSSSLEGINALREALKGIHQGSSRQTVLNDFINSCRSRLWGLASLQNPTNAELVFSSCQGQRRQWLPNVDFHYLSALSSTLENIDDLDFSVDNSFVFLRIMVGTSAILLKVIPTTVPCGISSGNRPLSQPQAEYQLPLSMLPHRSIVPILHHYTIDTRDLTRGLLPITSPGLHTIKCALQPYSQVTCVAMPEYPTTLEKFVTSSLRSGRLLSETFLLQLMYQLLSAVTHLQNYGIVHRDIRSENVFLDHDLNAILGNFGSSRALLTSEGLPINYMGSEEMIEATWSEATLRNNSTDTYAVGKLLRDILQLNDSNLRRHEIPPISSYSSEFRSILRSLLQTELTARQALIRTGVLLYGSDLKDISSEFECHLWLAVKLIKRLATSQRFEQKTTTRNGEGPVTMETSVELKPSQIELDFLLSTTPLELWENLQSTRHL